MSKIQGKVTKVETKDFNSQSLGAMQSHKITVQAEDGVTATATKNTKKSTGFKLDVGTEVSMEYKTEEVNYNGKTFNVNKIIDKGLAILNQTKTAKPEAAPTKASYKAVSTHPAPGYDYAAKDLSMEVSGLLQAIIQHHGLDKTTGNKLREALALKRQIAGELKDGAFKYTEEKSSNTTTKKGFKEEPKQSNDDSCPFDLDA